MAGVNDFPARAVVDLGALRGNVRTLASLAPTAQVMAVVKADAYGHGLVPSALAALEGGATWLGTAQVTEALHLRRAGVTGARILTWLYAPGAPLREAVEADVDLSVASRWALDDVVAAAREAGRTARVHLKIDTGLGRNGLLPAQLPDVLAAALAAEAEGLVRVVGVWSHLAFADAPDHAVVGRQAAVFTDAVAAVEAAGARLEVRHLANSAATLTAPALHWDLVRPGIAVYGLTPVPQLGGPERFGLVPAMTFEAQLATVKPVPAGSGVSYGHEYVVPRDTVLGVVPLGYADGIPRHASGTADRWGGPVQVGGRRLGIAGRVCMDQVVLDLGPGASDAAGDRVVLWGDGRDGGPTAQDWAEVAGTISYELVTRLGARVPRVYVDSEQGRAGAQALATAVPSSAGGGVA
ncbi:alanine racemase [Cellulomonas dongxiuzhuiae]|uniref:Alanine racemase n=1 Tax=Cellulomonas dongxiuzhuiae TaxID=2819979 RepID=A0ABX8GP22_9CELL|nr:alanine racemase [Cellulomonas dongxiuzhuiae]QWC17937.1 alanine racemase [Cellulomonas dongxiuzhuiae]